MLVVEGEEEILMTQENSGLKRWLHMYMLEPPVTSFMQKAKGPLIPVHYRHAVIGNITNYIILFTDTIYWREISKSCLCHMCILLHVGFTRLATNCFCIAVFLLWKWCCGGSRKL